LCSKRRNRNYASDRRTLFTEQRVWPNSIFGKAAIISGVTYPLQKS